MTIVAAILMLSADTVRGKVHDAAGKAIPGAEIVVENIGRLSTTSTTGEFVIDAPAGATIVVRRPGYKPVAYRTTSDKSVDIELQLAPFPVDPVQVTATRTPREASASLAVSVQGSNELRREAGVSLAHELKQLPGVRVVSTGEQVGKPMIRGLFGSRVLVLEDAQRIEDYSWSDEDAPSIDARFADRVEVVRGPESLFYGSDALGGVVNVIPAPLPQPGSLSRSGIEMSASSNRKEGGIVARHEGATNSLGYRALLVGRFALDYATPRGEVPNTGFGAFNGELQVGTKNVTARYARYGGEFKLLEMDAPPPAPGVEEEEEGPVRKLSDDRLQVVGRFRTVETRAQYQRHWLQEVADLPGQAGVKGKEEPIFDLLLNTLSGDAMMRNRYGSVGVSALTQKHDSRGPLLIVPGASVSNVALFAAEQLNAGIMEFHVGARVDHHTIEDNKHNAASWNAGIVAHTSTTVSLRGNVGSAWRAPNLFELFANGPRIGEGRYEIGDATLDPERSLEFDGGVDVNSAKLRLQASVFSNRINDYIALQPTNAFQQNLRVYRQQQTTAQLKGIEAIVDVRPIRNVSIVAEYDAVRGDDVDNKTNLPWIPAPRMHSHIELAKDNRYVRAGFEHTWAKSRRAANEPAVSGYTLLNAAVGGALKLGGRETRIDLTGRNLGNVEYKDFLSRYRDFALNPGVDVSLRISMEL